MRRVIRYVAILVGVLEERGGSKGEKKGKVGEKGDREEGEGFIHIQGTV